MTQTQQSMLWQAKGQVPPNRGGHQTRGRHRRLQKVPLWVRSFPTSMSCNSCSNKRRAKELKCSYSLVLAYEALCFQSVECTTSQFNHSCHHESLPISHCNTPLDERDRLLQPSATIHMQTCYQETIKPLKAALVLKKMLKKRKSIKRKSIKDGKKTHQRTWDTSPKSCSLILHSCTSVTLDIFGLSQMARCNFTPVPSSLQRIEQSHDSKILSQQLLWELLEAVSGSAIMGILSRVQESYFPATSSSLR